MQRFSDRYLQDFSGEDFFSVQYYITFVLNYKGTLTEGEDELSDILKTASAALKCFDSKVLKIGDDHRNEHLEFLSYLLNYNDQPKPLTSEKVRNYIGHSDWHFGHDLLEVRNANNQTTRFATFFELDALPSTTEMGMWDFILSQPTEFILTQSMIFMQSLKAQKVIDRQTNFIESSDNVEHELEELQAARDHVASGTVNFGDYHASLAVIGDSPDKVIVDSADLNGQFLANGTVLKRSNLKSQFSFLSALPASKMRIKPSPRTIANLTSTWSLHNYSTGKAIGNPIGDGSAILPLKTRSNSLFHFNCHASTVGQDNTGEKIAGHTMILGASGSGKTTLEYHTHRLFHSL